MDNCKCVEANLNHERFKFVFSVVLPQRIYYLVAGTQLEMEDWVDKLIKVCGFKRTDECHSQGKCYKTLHCKLSESFNPLTAEWALRALIDFTLSNARRFSLVNGEPLGRERVKQICVETSAMCVLQFYVVLWSRLSSEDVWSCYSSLRINPVCEKWFLRCQTVIFKNSIINLLAGKNVQDTFRKFEIFG